MADVGAPVAIAHTPGPWDRGPYVGDNIHVITTTEHPWVGRIVAKVPALNIVDGEANARLIAAAPDLLAAIKALMAEVERRDNPSDEGCSSDCDQMDAAKAAVAKAEGLSLIHI